MKKLNKTVRIAGIAGAISFLSLGLVGYSIESASAETVQNSLASVNQELQELSSQNSELQKAFNEAKQKKDDLTKIVEKRGAFLEAVKKAQGSIDSLPSGTDVESLKNDIKAAQDELVKLDSNPNRVDELTDSVNSTNDKIVAAGQARQAAIDAANKAAASKKASSTRVSNSSSSSGSSSSSKKSGSSSNSSRGSSSSGGVSWSVRVTNSGASQAAVDACSGGLTYYGTYYGAAYLPIHVNCGGARILSLQIGQTVHISGGGFDGTYRVTGSKNVPKGASSEQLRGLGPDAILQTCYTSGNLMRLIGLQKI